MVGKQQSPRFTVIHRDTDVPLVEDNAISLEGCLHTAILEAVKHYQDDSFRLVAHKFAALIQQPFQDSLPLQVVQFDLVEFLHIGIERFFFPFFGRRVCVPLLSLGGLSLCLFPQHWIEGLFDEIIQQRLLGRENLQFQLGQNGFDFCGYGAIISAADNERRYNVT